MSPIWTGDKCDRVLVDLTGGLGDFLLFFRFIKIGMLDRGIPVFLNYGCGAPQESKRELIEFAKKQSWCRSELLDHGDTNVAEAVLPTTNYDNLLRLFPCKPETFATEYAPPLWEADSSYRPSFVDGLRRPLVAFCGEAGKSTMTLAGRHDDRSLSREQIEKVIRSAPELSWVNVGPNPIELPGVLNFRGSIEETAALIAATDMTVSVDTFACHLSASLGKKTFLLLSDRPSWFWAWNWYSNFMELIRSATPGLDGAVASPIERLKSFR